MMRGNLERKSGRACVTLAFTSPIHPTGLPPVSSLKSAMLGDTLDDGVSDPAANILDDGS